MPKSSKPKPPPDPSLPPAQRRLARTQAYDTAPMAQRLTQLLEQHNETLREAGLRAGLDHQALRRIVRREMRPTVQTCILLADHFDINPNELLQMAGHPRLKLFDVHSPTTEPLPPEVVAVAQDLTRIREPHVRRAVAEAIRALLAQYFEIDSLRER